MNTEVVEWILKPLSKATETLLKPERLGNHDYLRIDLDTDKDKFVLTPFCAEPSPSGEFTTATGVTIRSIEWAGSSTGAYDWFRRIPELYLVKSGQYRVSRKKKDVVYNSGPYAAAVTDFTALVIHHVWPRDKIVFEDEFADLQYNYLLKRFFHQTKCARIVADFKANKTIPELGQYFVDHPDWSLSRCQKTGVAAQLNQPAYALFFEQGVGKTPTAIGRVMTEARMKKAGALAGSYPGPYRTLVIAPRSVRANWEWEFSRFSTLHGKVCVLRGGLVGRTRCLVDTVRVEPDLDWSTAIISMDSLESTLEVLQKIPWDLIIVDECQHFKSRGTQRWKAIRKLIQDGKVRSKLILTGTPIANSIFDIWAQLEILGTGMSGFISMERFKKFHGKFRKLDGTPVQKLIGLKSVGLIQERLARLSFLLTKKEAELDLPDKVYDIVEVQMTAKQREVYQDLAENLVAEIESMDEEEASRSITVEHILTKLLRLAQVTSGHIRIDKDSEVDAGLVQQISYPNPKVQAVLEILQDPDRDTKGKMIVWAAFVEDLRVLSYELANAGIKHVGYHAAIHPDFRVAGASEASETFNADPECRVFLANPASAGEGLNILGYNYREPEQSDTYVNHVIYFSSDWSFLKRAQSEDRCHRRGTRCNVRITDLVVPGTIDEEIRCRIFEKKTKAMMIQDVRQILSRLRKVRIED